MMIAYNLSKPTPEAEPMEGTHEVTLKAEDEADVSRLMALITLAQHGRLTGAIDLAISAAYKHETEGE